MSLLVSGWIIELLIPKRQPTIREYTVTGISIIYIPKIPITNSIVSIKQTIKTGLKSSLIFNSNFILSVTLYFFI